jgi:hypothetical protein
MVVNPFDAYSHRYPDETIIPTGLVKFNKAITYTVNSDGATNGFATILNWKVRDATGGAYTIFGPWPFAGSASASDYGTPQSSWRALDTIDRTLAAAVRVRLLGLPDSSYLPTGTLYFLQYQPGEVLGSFDSESECVAAVTAKRGFSLTTAEIARLGAVHIPFLPQGPMSFLFSASNAADADSASTLADTSVVSPNGGLVVVAFGVKSDTSFRFDFTHHVEYVPGVGSAGLIETRVEMPSVVEREKISNGSQQVISAIAGGTSATDLVPITHRISGGGPGSSAPFGAQASSIGSTMSTMLDVLSGAAPVIQALSKVF